MKRRVLIIAAFVLSGCLLLCSCGKKEEPVPETSSIEEDSAYEKNDVTMEIAKDDVLRSFLNAFDPFTDGGPAGSMEYDYRDTISVRRLMDCLFGQRCCADYQAYPLAQPAYEGDVLTVPGESFSWAAENIFHVPASDVAAYQEAAPAYSDGAFSTTITKNINGVQWYYSDFTITRAEYDGSYYYVKYKRNHDDPSVGGEVYQKEYYTVLAKENIGGSEFWTMYTHSSNGFNYVIADENLLPDVTFEEEKEMVINAETAVTMRSGPSTEYGAITSYNPGVPVMAVGTKGEWTYVHYYDHYGWIFSEFLSEDN
ncbi:MAG: SH3 domain-containing protein [Lachnospiraceae bacterium]|nr:SH3 domain-containing protein [Lachnospiraceae bacterium]